MEQATLTKIASSIISTDNSLKFWHSISTGVTACLPLFKFAFNMVDRRRQKLQELFTGHFLWSLKSINILQDRSTVSASFKNSTFEMNVFIFLFAPPFNLNLSSFFLDDNAVCPTESPANKISFPWQSTFCLGIPCLATVLFELFSTPPGIGISGATSAVVFGTGRPCKKPEAKS